MGALVGVTDKAVSKWENGASKPRINTVKKLAQVLDVGIDELLTCEYNSVCKGKYLKNTMPQEIEKLLDENEVPEWYIESMKKIRYLFPKAHIIASLKKDIEEFLILEKNRKLY